MSAWWVYRPRFTAADLLESGACLQGVAEAVQRAGRLEAETTKHADNEHVCRAAHVDGSGSGYGDGYGDGSGSGDGS